jgi:cold shock protein
VEHDLDPTSLARPATDRRDVDEVAASQGGLDAIVHVVFGSGGDRLLRGQPPYAWRLQGASDRAPSPFGVSRGMALRGTVAPRRDVRWDAAWSTLFSNGPCACHPAFGKSRRSTMATGTIKRVVSDRGFGFIAADDEKEYFFHRDGLDSSLDFDRLVGGETVEFEVEQNPKGPRAKQVRKA